jgi:3-oxoacyl-[acyl-carrier protein] reductase
MDLGLEDKVAVITGASRGIGKGIATALGLEGCKLSICARKSEDLRNSAAELKGQNIEVLDLQLDITIGEDCSQLVTATIEKYGRIDILVNNVGGNIRKVFEETSDADWEDILNLNLTSHIKVNRYVVQHMKKNGSGSIIFIASIFGREAGGPTLSIYNTTKSGMISLAKIMAIELAPFGIRVNTVAPGSVLFPGGSWDRRSKQDPQGIKKFIERELPFGRFGTVEEIANVVAFLASEKASWISGACINVDGCQSRSLI